MTDNATIWTDDRPQQDSLPIDPDNRPRNSRIDDGASEDFIDDRNEPNKPTTNRGKQRTLSGETVEDRKARENSDSASLGDF